MLTLAVLVSGAAWGLPGRGGRVPGPARATTLDKNCYYAGDLYSWNACRGGQRCARGRDDEYYWEDDPTCPGAGDSQGGFRVY